MVKWVGFALAFGLVAFNVPDITASRAFFCRNGQTVDLGVLPGTPNGNIYPESLNEKGQIVGAADVASGSTAFLYEDGKIYDLMALISVDDPLHGFVQLLAGCTINDEGDIAANGKDLRTGVSHVYLLTPRRPRSTQPSRRELTRLAGPASGRAPKAPAWSSAATKEPCRSRSGVTSSNN